MVEDLLLSGIPVIAVDPQGDIAAMACSDDEDWLDKVDPVIWTPGSKAGRLLAMNPMNALDGAENLDPTEQAALVRQVAANIAGVCGYDLESAKGKTAMVVLELVLMENLEILGGERPYFALDEETGEIENLFRPAAISLDDIARRLSPGSFSHVASKNAVETLAKNLQRACVGVNGLLYNSADTLNIDELLGLNEERTRLSVIYLNSLTTQEQKDAVVAYLSNMLYAWMLKHPKRDLQAVFYLDEIAPFLPAGMKKTNAKSALQILFKQARKYGVGCLIATQNPGDVDYKSLSQFNTWLVGRLRTPQDQKKVEHLYPDRRKARLLGNKRVGEFDLLSGDAGTEPQAVRFPMCRTPHFVAVEADFPDVWDESEESKGVTASERRGYVVAEPARLLPQREKALRRRVRQYFDGKRRAWEYAEERERRREELRREIKAKEREIEEFVEENKFYLAFDIRGDGRMALLFQAVLTALFCISQAIAHVFDDAFMSTFFGNVLSITWVVLSVLLSITGPVEKAISDHIKKKKSELVEELIELWRYYVDEE